MTPRPQFDAVYLEAELQELGTTLRTEVTAFLIGGGAMAFRGLKDTTKEMDTGFVDTGKRDKFNE